MKKYVIAIGLVATIAIALLAQAGFGIKNGWFGNDRNKNDGKMDMGKMAKLRKMMNRGMKARNMYRNLLNMDREEGNLSYQNGIFYVNNMPLYVGDNYWLNHTIRSDYDGDGSYEIIWQELNGLIGKNVVVNGKYDNGTLIVSHINGMFLRMPFVADFVTINGQLEFNNGSYFINGYKIIVPNRMARSDYDNDSMLEKMWQELNGLMGSNVTIDGYIFNENIRAIHINGIAC